MFVNRSGCTYFGERNHNVYTFRHGGPITSVQCGLTEECASINELCVFETVNRFDILGNNDYFIMEGSNDKNDEVSHISFGNDCSPNLYVKSHVDNVHIMYDINYVNGNSKNDGGNCDKCEESVALKCGHASFNTCKICMSAYGSFSKIV